MTDIVGQYWRCVHWFARLANEGIDLTTNAHLKVKHEAAEYAEDRSMEEAADVFISLIGSLQQDGYTLWDLAQAVDKKMAVNEERTWTKLPDGTYQHV